MLFFAVIALTAAGPLVRDDDDDDRPKRHVVRHVRREQDDIDDPGRPNIPAPPARSPVVQGASPPAVAPRPSATAPVSPDAEDADHDDERRAPDNAITVTARRLDTARAAIEPALGASTYTLSNEAIENRPGGETRSLGSVLVQAPGVGRDARGGMVVRSSAGGLEYRLNNIILPKGAGDFGETLSARLAGKTELITGALPAQYGLAPGGVVNVTTKNGHYFAGGQAELYGGAHGTFEPAFEWSHAAGSTSLFLSASLQRSRLGLPAPDTSDQPFHDRRRELEGFAFVDHVLDATSRMSLMAGSVNEQQQIPALAVADVGGGERRFGTLTGHSHYAIAAYQLSSGPLSFQASLSQLAAIRIAAPEEPLHLAVDGRSFGLHDRHRSTGLQVEASYAAGAHHLLRGGLVASVDRLGRDERTVTLAGSLDQFLAVKRSSLSLFAQDQWALTDQLTANLGLRVDRVTSTDQHAHVQPRASLVWAIGAGITAHANYARSIVAAPLDDVASETNTFRRVERDSLFDAGLERKLGGLTLGIDVYDRRARDFIATHWRTDAPVGDAFSIAHAHFRGVEFVNTYAQGPLTVWSNIALSRATGDGITGGGSNLDPLQAAYLVTHRVALDTDQRLTISAGASYHIGQVLLSASLLAGSGTLRSIPGGQPNGSRGHAYAIADFAMVWHLRLIERQPTDLRLDLRNSSDRHEALADGTGIMGGAPGYTEPRGLYIGIEQSF